MIFLAELTDGLIQDNARAHGQVETADIVVLHGNGITALMVQRKNFLIKAPGLATKDQSAGWAELCVEIRCIGFSAKKEEQILVLGAEICVQIRPMPDPNMGPVIEACSFEMPVIGRKSKGMDEIKCGIGRPA